MLARTLRVAYPHCHIARFATRRPVSIIITHSCPCPAPLTPSTHTGARLSTFTLTHADMLCRATGQPKKGSQTSSKPPPPPTLQQTTEKTKQAGIEAAFKSSQPSHSQHFAGALKNSRPHNLNAGDPFTSYKPPTSSASENRLRRSKPAGEDRLSQVCDNSSAFEDSMTSNTTTTTKTTSTWTKTSSSSFSHTSNSYTTQSSLASLHEAVYFDIDDFDDDLSLDFDLDEPIMAPELKAAVASLPPSLPPTLPPPTPKHLQAPDSSAPLPWSSSPIRYKPTTAAPRPPVQVYSQDSITLEKRAQRATAPPQQLAQPPSRLGTSRRIPWLEKKTDEFCEKVVEKTEKRPSTRDSKESNSSSSRPSSRPKTPHKPSMATNMPWDMTASALKANRAEIKVKGGVSQKRNINMSASAGDMDMEAPLKKVKPDQPAPIFLSEEQRRVITMVRDMNKSVFFTGSAGTGKSVLLRQLITELRKKYSKEPDRVAVTASTGLAACNIGGVTLHSFSGIGLGKEPTADLVKKIKKNQKAKSRWLRTKVLIIDEISMVDGALFDKLEGVARLLRNNGRPFGGIQLVITGDFFQLPPVPEKGGISRFAFDAQSWGTSIEHTIGLTQVFRQRDAEFADMLNEMRLGKISSQTAQTFQKLSRPLTFDDGIQATELFPTRNEVDAANNAKMRLIKGETVVFEAVDSGTTQDRMAREKLLSNCMAAAKIELKINAQVMLIKNMDDTLVNGSLGRVVAFMTDKSYEMMESEGGLEAVDAEGGVEVVDLDEEEDLLAKRRKRIKAQLAALAAKDNGIKWPLVQFAVADGTTRQILVQPESWKVELPNGEVQAQRTQLPLILAWALSIHKAQGQTLERVKVDLGKVFEKGQAYVALSRATCKEGLQVLNFSPNKVMAHEKVRAFYASLYSALDAGKKAQKAQVVEMGGGGGERGGRGEKAQKEQKARERRGKRDDEDEYDEDDMEEFEVAMYNDRKGFASGAS